MCYGKWDALDEPGWYHHETGEYQPVWTFCPHCAAKWDGQVEGYGERSLGPRRQRIEEATHKRGWPSPPEPVFWWVIEDRTYWPEYPDDDKMNAWSPVQKIKGLTYPTWLVLRYFRGYEEPYRDTMFNTEHQRRLVKYSVGELSNYSSPYEIYLDNYLDNLKAHGKL
jgi:hypothetical protein